MLHMTKILLFPLLIYFSVSCRSSKDSYYSYSIENYTFDTVKHFVTSSNLISYGRYLFEFKRKINIQSSQHGELAEVITSIDYDTTGVYLLTSRKLYYEFDTFALNTKIVRKGKLAEKASGVKMKTTGTTVDPFLSYATPKEAMTNNIKCFYSQIISKNKKIIDTIEQKISLIKDRNFNSFYKINGITYPDKNYCIVGVMIFDPSQNGGYAEEISDLRQLTEDERKICESMVKQVKKMEDQ